MNFSQMLLATVEPQKSKTRKRGDLVESLRQQLAAAREREQTNDTLLEQQGDKLAALNDLLANREAQIVMLRGYLEKIAFGRVGKCGSIIQELFDRETWAAEALAATEPKP